MQCSNIRNCVTNEILSHMLWIYFIMTWTALQYLVAVMSRLFNGRLHPLLSIAISIAAAKFHVSNIGIWKSKITCFYFCSPVCGGLLSCLSKLLCNKLHPWLSQHFALSSVQQFFLSSLRLKKPPYARVQFPGIISLSAGFWTWHYRIHLYPGASSTSIVRWQVSLMALLHSSHSSLRFSGTKKKNSESIKLSVRWWDSGDCVFYWFRT